MDKYRMFRESCQHTGLLSGYSIDIERNVCEDPLYYID